MARLHVGVARRGGGERDARGARVREQELGITGAAELKLEGELSISARPESAGSLQGSIGALASGAFAIQPPAIGSLSDYIATHHFYYQVFSAARP